MFFFLFHIYIYSHLFDLVFFIKFSKIQKDINCFNRILEVMWFLVLYNFNLLNLLFNLRVFVLKNISNCRLWFVISSKVTPKVRILSLKNVILIITNTNITYNNIIKCQCQYTLYIFLFISKISISMISVMYLWYVVFFFPLIEYNYHRLIGYLIHLTFEDDVLYFI